MRLSKMIRPAVVVGLFVQGLNCAQVQADNNSAWMSGLSNSTYVSQLSIPGTHDSGTGHGFPTLYYVTGNLHARTQDKTLTEQFNSGIRAFDLRPCVDGSTLRINHGIIPTELTMSSALNTLCNLLDQNPTEFVIVLIRHETEGDDNNSNFNSMMLSLLNSSPVNSHTVNFNPWLTVGDMRGKILFLSRSEYASTPIGGFVRDWNNNSNFSGQQGGKIVRGSTQAPCYIQDFFECTASGAKTVKTNSILTLLGYTGEQNTDPCLWAINHTSGYSKAVFGIVTSDGYRDNAATQNPAVVNYLNSHSGATGLVLMDYAGENSSGDYNVYGQNLTNALINNNFRESTYSAYFRALPQIVPGKSYRIFTVKNGVKYYLTRDGYLDTTPAEQFVFNRIAGDAYKYGFQLAGKYFTNPPMSGGNVNLTPGHICTYGNNPRYNWEAQVFLLGTNGKYAVRSTNSAGGNSGWSLAARTYWTVTDSSTPAAAYSFSEQYIWQIESCIPDPSYLSNNRVYTIRTPRGYLTLNNAGTCLVSSHKSNGTLVNSNAATDDASRRFGIMYIDGNYYIYSPKLKKFARQDNQTMNFYATSGIPLMFTYDGIVGVEGSILRMRSTQNVHFINNNNSGYIVLNGYTTPDPGNVLTIEEVPGVTLNESEALSIFYSAGVKRDIVDVIKDAGTDAQESQIFYDLLGRPTTQPKRGTYIYKGQTIYVK